MVENLSKAKRLKDFIPSFRPDFEPISRSLAMYSAAIAISDEGGIKDTAVKANELGAGVESIYEIMLQSYLFLGFPRMLTAAESFRSLYPNYDIKVDSPAPKDFEKWKASGTEICRRVYGANYGKLKDKVISFTPEIFEWMILEGYGKVLSRQALDIKTRELAVVSCLLIENRPKQLHSHMRGALNVGVNEKLLRTVISDLENIDEAGYETAFKLLESINVDV
jgi:4-carboxymuconolactone decarboxylase